MDADINLAYKEYAALKDTASLENIVADGEGIVRHFSALYGEGFDSDDLYQTGMIGLLRAAETFDPKNGAAFSSWAATCVISEIRHFVRRERAHSRPTGDDASTEQKHEGGTAQNSANSVNRTVFMPLTDADTDASCDKQQFHLELDDKIALEQAAASLGEQEREVLHALFYRGMTQQEVADELGISQRRVSRQKNTALKMMRELLDPASFHFIDSKYSFKNVSKIKYNK